MRPGKLCIEAIKTLPEDWSTDQTDFVVNILTVYAFHPDRKPIEYDPVKKIWLEVNL